MNFKHLLSIWWIFSTFIFANLNADKILYHISTHLNGLNRSMVIESNIIKKGKIKKTQKIKVQIYWPNDSDKERLTLIDFFKPKQKVGVKFWEHTFINNTRTLNWMIMPVTGKLKDISNKKAKKNDFDFSDLQLTKETIAAHQNSIIEDFNVIIIEAISKNNKQKKRLYIDKENNFIQKVETFSKNNKLMKSVECIEYQMVNNYKIASKVVIEDFKKKHTVNVHITDFKFTNFSDKSIFEPKGN